MTFKVKWVDDVPTGRKSFRAFCSAQKKLTAQLKRDKMRLVGMDDSGFLLYQN